MKTTFTRKIPRELFDNFLILRHLINKNQYILISYLMDRRLCNKCLSSLTPSLPLRFDTCRMGRAQCSCSMQRVLWKERAAAQAKERRMEIRRFHMNTTGKHSNRYCRVEWQSGQSRSIARSVAAASLLLCSLWLTLEQFRRGFAVTPVVHVGLLLLYIKPRDTVQLTVCECWRRRSRRRVQFSCRLSFSWIRWRK